MSRESDGMMNKRVSISILLGALAVVGVTSFLGFNIGYAFDFFAKSTVDEPLKKVVFNSGGDSLGSHHSMTVKALTNNTACVEYADAAWHHQIPEIKEYVVPSTVLEDIKQVFNKNKLARLEKAPNSKLMALDAATSSYSFEFEKKRVRFSSTQSLPKSGYQALRDIKKLVEEACQKGKLLPSLVVVRDKLDGKDNTYAVVKGQVGIKVTAYRQTGLDVTIGNGLEKEQAVSCVYQITTLAQPKVPVAAATTAETINVSSNENYEYRIALQEALAPGKYKLILGGYTTEFEIR